MKRTSLFATIMVVASIACPALAQTPTHDFLKTIGGSIPATPFILINLNRYRTDLGGGLTGSVMRLGAEVGTKGAMVDTITAAQAAVQKRHP
jgi:hypothetical protein